ncbi:calcium-binding protein [Ferruginivarius sediminum]|uniref:Calcium-binding protein n=1 Tax=Ferruginivarius sediminum TaxID=2661937 RepID=A0A369T7A7_9PROT|nr:hypothetical protein [Ferruginivarius sediminum]RDD61158.1 hypothetical protein DRB17_14800 [Ferruginivarius sediminum]
MTSPIIYGTKHDDNLAADHADLTIFGLHGDDVLTSTFNRTTLDGGKHSDTLISDVEVSGHPGETVEAVTTQHGRHGRDTLDAAVTASFGSETYAHTELDGGDGDDDITAQASAMTEALILDESATASAHNDIDGGAGHDTIDATAFADGLFNVDLTAINDIDGGDGDDVIHATAEIAFFSAPDSSTALNIVDGGKGHDTIHAVATGDFSGLHSDVRNELMGGSGNDTLTAEAVAQSNGGRSATNLLYGGDGEDTLSAHALGNSNSDTVEVSNTLYGGAGHDILMAEARGIHSFLNTVENTLSGGDGNDTLIAEATVTLLEPGGFFGVSTATNILYGGNGDDEMQATARMDAETPQDGTAENILDGGKGDDTLTATIAPGSPGRSTLSGGRGDDVLQVHGGSDNELDGGRGQDTLIGGDGDEFMTGGPGGDLFVFAANAGNDTILDFEDGRDLIELRGFDYGDLAEVSVRDDGADAIVQLDADNEVTVLGAAGLIGADDFWYA